jgi:PAS domain S-box-containing protein
MSTNAADYNQSTSPEFRGPDHDAATRVPRSRRLALHAQRFWAWIQEHTTAPPWLPSRLRRPQSGVLVGLALIAAIFIVAPLLLPSVHGVPLSLFMLFEAIVFTALVWGTGPSILVTLLGIVVIDHFQWDPRPALTPETTAIFVDDFFTLAIGLLVGFLAGQNVEAHKRAERLRALSEEHRHRLDTVLQVQPAGIALADANGKLLQYNDAFGAIWGAHAPLVSEIADYARYRGWWPQTGKPISSEQWALARALQHDERCPPEEVDILSFDGTRKTILNAAEPLHDDHGNVSGAVVAEMDISDRKRMEEGLRMAKYEAERAEAGFRALVELAPDAIVVLDPNGFMSLVNRQAEELFGYSRDALLGKAFEPLVAERCHAALHRCLAELIDVHGGAPRACERKEIIGRRQDGGAFPAEVSVGAFTVAQETEIMVILRDATEQRRREHQVREALHALLALAEAVVSPSDSTTAGDEEQTASPEIPAMHHYAELIREIFASRQVHVGVIDPVTDQYTLVAVSGVTMEEARRQKDLLQRAALSTYLTNEQLQELRAGTTIVVNSTQSEHQSSLRTIIAPLRWDGRLIGLLGLSYLQEEAAYGPETQALVRAGARLAELLLEHARIVAQREEAQATTLALQETTRQMDAFLGMATHELKTPLTAILLALQLNRRRLEGLRRRSRDLSGGVAEQLDTVVDEQIKVESQAKRLDRLVNDLLDLSRLQAGKLQIHPERIDLAAIVQRAVQQQQQVAPDRAIQLRLSQPEQPVWVYADADRLEQVLLNYLTNALKYSPPDQPVEVGCDIEGSRARVWVRDRGPGLPEAEQKRLWQQYYRVPGIEVQSGTGVGLGLGLMIVKQIVQLHGGEVGLTSAPGRGSTFWFTLPLAETGGT